MVHAVAFEIRYPVGTHSYRVLRAHTAVTARRFWARCADWKGARLRVIANTGEEFGTKTFFDTHGVTCFTERCAQCEREFVTPRVGEHLCPGCELLLTGDVSLEARF
jgi:hypothetical protein